MSASALLHPLPSSPPVVGRVRRFASRAAAVPAAIRPVRAGDCETLLRLCREHAEGAGSERTPFGPRCSDARDLVEALFDPPVRVWAWIAEAEGEAIGYAGALAGCSLLEGGNYFQLESLYVRAHPQAQDIERRLFLRALRMARTLGCLNLQWRLPAVQAARVEAQLPAAAVRTALVHYVLPLADQAAGRAAHGG
ncbi:GNAT family N-acetyltransferase [Luteimonas sp. R10]|uniref:GNAT family N-acetyltransferase n=1 Tax=Luteimonas sp. R10 TaxID=3108176 RepID=UPI0030912EBB|nr:GNAT family N-acetyltransferase [Luteimonas sp. R10]